MRLFAWYVNMACSGANNIVNFANNFCPCFFFFRHDFFVTDVLCPFCFACPNPNQTQFIVTRDFFFPPLSDACVLVLNASQPLFVLLYFSSHHLTLSPIVFGLIHHYLFFKILLFNFNVPLFCGYIPSFCSFIRSLWLKTL